MKPCLDPVDVSALVAFGPRKTFGVEDLQKRQVEVQNASGRECKANVIKLATARRVYGSLGYAKREGVSDGGIRGFRIEHSSF